MQVLPFENFYCRPPICGMNTRSRYTDNLYTIDSRTDYKKYNFASRTTSIWNSLPQVIRESHSLISFKRGIESLDFSRFLKGRP